MKVILLFFVTIAVFGCGNNSKKKINNSNSVKEEIIYPGDSDTIQMNFQNGYGEIEIHKNEGQAVYLKFDSESYHYLSGELTSADSTANIRFNQIIKPDLTMDGPFGREIKYDLSKNGNYILSIQESLMAGDPWEGTFTVTIRLSN